MVENKKIIFNKAVNYYTETALKSVNPVMALTGIKKKNNFVGVAREIIKRKGNPAIEGFVDKSKLIIVKSINGINWKKIVT